MPTLLVQAFEFFSGQPYQPHGYCLLWSPELVATHVTADSLIALSYYSIPFGLFYFARKRQDLAYRWLFLMFAVFIFGCGTTHVMDIWTLWFPNYWTDAIIRHVTAVASVSTAVALWLLIPHALRLPSPKELQRVNEELVREIFDRQRAEEELKRVNHQLQQRTRELEDLNTELEAFSYSISHDLRAPLRGIDGFSQALSEDYGHKLDDGGRQYLERVRSAARRMGRLIDDLLALSQVSREELSKKEIDLSELAREVASDLVAPDLEQDVVTVQPYLTAYGDPGLLQVVLENLIGNALKYSKRQETPVVVVGCATTAEGEQAYFVKDNGVGFDPGHAQRLFQPFHRLHDGREFEGTGIGLALVQRIVSRHGGRVWAESALGAGATFYFTLPGQVETPGKKCLPTG